MLPELKEKLEASAKAAGRSMNAEIVARLQKSFEPEAGGVPLDLVLEKRTLEARLETARAHMMTVLLYMSSLETKRDSAIQRGAGSDEIEKLNAMLESGAEDEKRLMDQVGDLVDQMKAFDKKFDEAQTEVEKKLNMTVEKSMQAEYLQVQATESKLGIAPDKRTVKKRVSVK